MLRQRDNAASGQGAMPPDIFNIVHGEAASLTKILLLPQNKHFGTPKTFFSTKKFWAGYATEFGHRISSWVLNWPSDKFEFETPAVDQDLLLHRSHNLNIKLHVHGSINSCHTYVCASLLRR